jgi:hypothetical protein
MRKNGTPSRRSSLARVSRPNSRAAPPTRWANPIHITESNPGSAFCTAFLGAGYLFVGWFRVLDEDRDDPERARVVDDRVLVAIPSR